MLDTSAGANQLAEPGWYFNQDIPESEWMAQSPPCSDTVTPGDPPEFELESPTPRASGCIGALTTQQRPAASGCGEAPKL